jgi:hypothetical protein
LLCPFVGAMEPLLSVGLRNRRSEVRILTGAFTEMRVVAGLSSMTVGAGSPACVTVHRLGAARSQVVNRHALHSGGSSTGCRPNVFDDGDDRRGGLIDGQVAGVDAGLVAPP